jgi:cellulose synthase/poly-beta-1,6-N-acetylglucosamine synthase-like glycosyltransferase
METLFLASVLVLAYVYAGYPVLLAIWSSAGGRPARKRGPSAAEGWPAVSVVVAAHNEASRLPGRIANLLAQNYPGSLDIVIVSDGSTDQPQRALEHFDDRVQLVELPRGGKALALNAGVAATRGEIIAFADARQRWDIDATRELVSNFQDPEVGAATGELFLDSESRPNPSESTVGEAVGLYWKYEKWLRRRESLVWSTMGATGAIYALRRSLWRPLPARTLLDDVLAPMRCVLAGKRIVFDERARAYDRAVSDGAAEAQRKTRTLAGNYQILALEPRLLLPFANPVWVQYVSHKLGRLVAPWALIAAFLTSAVLAVDHWFHAVALILQLGFYGLAAIGSWIERETRNETVSGRRLPHAGSDTAEVRARTNARADVGTRAKAG